MEFVNQSTEDYKMAILSKKRTLNNNAFHTVIYDGENVDGVILQESTIFTINRDGCCAVLQHSNSPRFPKNMQYFLQSTLGLKEYSIASVITPKDLTLKKINFVDKITLSAAKNDKIDPNIIKKVSNTTNIKKGFIKKASMSIELEENCKLEFIDNILDDFRGYTNATIRGRDDSGDLLVDLINESITRYINLDLPEEIGKEQLKQIFDELIKSYNSI